MEIVIRHLAYNRVLANGVLCGTDVKKLTDLEIKVLHYPNPVTYNIRECSSDENVTTCFLRPIVKLVACVECLTKVKK